MSFRFNSLDCKSFSEKSPALIQYKYSLVFSSFLQTLFVLSNPPPYSSSTSRSFVTANKSKTLLTSYTFYSSLSIPFFGKEKIFSFNNQINVRKSTTNVFLFKKSVGSLDQMHFLLVVRVASRLSTFTISFLLGFQVFTVVSPARTPSIFLILVSFELHSCNFLVLSY